ncbi:D-alanyl-D-alanine dipeptidase [Pseudoalteromonas citrea]|uniref:D-alanyl-D-alanine dipeptidase n=2 Tax=Pseudoalteromonas citrea TaxID=43655 RepID=A0AAD4FQB4_9GAMM|nr:M15 family metallopeptidase [Pseudoalteromonas citrea]KAF7764839.1 D-alanyl-D-alanine dipeptidase [Pseudoalteromonas citrea]
MNKLIRYGVIFGASYIALSVQAKDLYDVKKAIPSLVTDIRYFGTDNFVGTAIDGYSAPKCLLSLSAVAALKVAQTSAQQFGLSLKVYDCYRPQRAVDHFVKWAEDLNDTKNKAKFYPEVDKSALFELGYIAAKSGHSRGSTLDVTLIDARSGVELDMGTSWDYFSPLSWPSSTKVNTQQRANRMLLAKVMLNSGFKGLKEEWWHFTLSNEPFKTQYFDVEITK